MKIWSGNVSCANNEKTSFDSGDFRGRFTLEARKADLAFVDLLGRIAAQKNATPAQIAIAWLLVQKPWIVPIPSTTKLHRLEENIATADVELTSDGMREIRDGISKITMQGAHLPEQVLKMSYR